MDKKAVIGIIVAAILLLIGSVGAVIYKNIRLGEIEEQQIIAAENKENGYDENGEPILYDEYSDPDNTGNHENLGVGQHVPELEELTGYWLCKNSYRVYISENGAISYKGTGEQKTENYQFSYDNTTGIFNITKGHIQESYIISKDDVQLNITNNITKEQYVCNREG